MDDDFKVIYDDYIDKRSLPLNLEEQDRKLFERVLEKHIKETKILYFSNFEVDSSLLLRRNGVLNSEISNIHNFKSACILSFLCKVLNKIHYKKVIGYHLKTIDDAIWVIDDWSKGYFHWLFDVLPKLLIAKEFIGDFNLLLPEKFKRYAYVLETLSLLEVEVIFFPLYEIIRILKLTYITLTAQSGDFNVKLLKKLREILLSKLGYDSKSYLTNVNRKIYVSRDKARLRKIKNESQVRKLLSKYGFEIHFFENLTWQEQMKIMVEAKYLVGPHGAGLSNMLFMPKRGWVLEIRDESNPNCYFSLASALGINYMYQMSLYDKRSKSFIVDIKKLEKNLNMMLNESY